MSNVVSIFKNKSADPSYASYINSLDKLELLEEMVKFQQERSRVGHLTVKMMVNGIVLFKALEDTAETPELRLLTRSYRKHLECELKANGQE